MKHITKAALLRAKTISIALKHTELTDEQRAALSTLPSIFCPCKRCYDECEYRLVHLNCPPVARQRYYLDKIIALMQFDRAKKYMLTLPPEKAITYAAAFIGLSEELFKLLATSQVSMLLSSTLVTTLPTEALKIDNLPLNQLIDLRKQLEWRIREHREGLSSREHIPRRATKPTYREQHLTKARRSTNENIRSNTIPRNS